MLSTGADGNRAGAGTLTGVANRCLQTHGELKNG